MYQATAKIWNEIADSQTLETDWAKQMFPLPPDDMLEALNREERRIAEEKDVPLRLATAYLLVMPLLWERRAIARYVASHPQAEAALPNVETVGEAVMLASKEYSITSQDQRQLAAMLVMPPA